MVLLTNLSNLSVKDEITNLFKQLDICSGNRSLGVCTQNTLIDHVETSTGQNDQSNGHLDSNFVGCHFHKELS